MESVRLLVMSPRLIQILDRCYAALEGARWTSNRKVAVLSWGTALACLQIAGPDLDLILYAPAVVLALIGGIAWGLEPHAGNRRPLSTDLRRTEEVPSAAPGRPRAEPTIPSPVDQAREALLSNLSHELRTPLTSIIAATEILRNFAGEDPQVQREFLEMIDNEAHRLLESIGSLLRLAELGDEPIRLEHEQLDLRETVRAAARASADRIATAGLPPTILTMPDTPIYVRGDRARILEVLARLLENCAKYASGKRGKSSLAAIEIRLERHPEVAEVHVLDEGPGVPAAQRAGLFRHFSPVDDLNTILTDKPGGVGAGLPICSRLIEAHGGQLSYRDREYRGACFTFTLPLAPSMLESPSAHPARTR